MRTIAILTLVLASALAVVSCGKLSSSTITTGLETLISLTEAAVDIATPQDAAQLQPYFNSLATFVDEVTTELATADTTAQKFSVISQDAAKIIAPNLSGVSAGVVTKIGALAPVIAQIVAEVEQLTARIAATPGGAEAFFAAHPVKPPSAKELAKIRAHNAALKAKLAAGAKK